MSNVLDRLEFLELFKQDVLASWDPYRDYLVRYGPNLYFKYELARMLNPQTIVEIGVRAGYSMWAMLLGCEAHYYGIDNWAVVEGVPEESAEMQKKCFDHAGMLSYQLGRYRVNFKVADTQAEDFQMPHAQLYHVDGAHLPAACRTDIFHCMQAGDEKSMILVHDYNAPNIRSATVDAARDHGLKLTYVCSEWGDAILTRGDPPSWVVDLRYRWREWWDPHSLNLVRSAWLDSDMFAAAMVDRPIDTEAATQELPSAEPAVVEGGEHNA
jgi:hypothetical protein